LRLCSFKLDRMSNRIAGARVGRMQDDDRISEPENGDLLARNRPVPWHSHVLPLALAAILVGLWLALPSAWVLQSWALSWSSLSREGIGPFALHILAHGGWAHLSLNVIALIVLSGPLIACLGNPPIGWGRYLYIFAGSGLSGGALFLAMNLSGGGAMLGASGAIFGILGALARVHPATGEAVPMNSRRTWLLTKFFVQNHIALFVLIAVVALLTGAAPMLAWEAHLGGLLFGFFIAPLYLRKGAQ
jgi:membrane associated rhomboid family serine protease